MPENLIGRVSVVDEVTGEHTPIDTRTRADAVSTDEGKTAQEKINDLNEHIENLAIHSTAYIETVWQVAIPIDGWVLEAPREDNFPYSLTMEYSGVLETHNAEITIDNDSIRAAVDCGLCPTMETMHNGLKFWSRTIPTNEILCHVTLFGEGGTSGGGEPEPPAGYAFLADEKGSLLLDEEGAYLVDKVDKRNERTADTVLVDKRNERTTDTISILEKPVASSVSKNAYVLGVQDEAEAGAALRRLPLTSAVEASGVVDDTLNKILDPDTYPLSATDDTVQSIALELGDYNQSTGAKEERSDAVRSAEYLKVSPGDIVYFTFSIPGGEEDAVRVFQYDAEKVFLSRIFKNVDEEFEVGSGVEYLCFYRSDTTDTTMTAALVIKGTVVKAEHKKVYFKDHGYEIRGDLVGGEENLHKLLIYSHGASDNTYNIVEIKAPIAQPDEATLCLMTDDGGNGLCQFVDFSCMTYGGGHTVEIVNQVRGRGPLPEFSIRFNDGKGAGRVKKLTVQPDAIPMELTSTGIKVRRNNAYDNKGAETDFVTVDLAETFDTVTTLKSIVVKLMSQVAPEKISTENGWEVGYINSDTGEKENSGGYIRTINDITVTADTLLVFSAVGGLLASGPLSVYEYESNGSYLGRTEIYEGDTLTTSATTAYIRLTANTGVVEAGSYATVTFYPGKMANTTSTEGGWELGSINSSTGAAVEGSSQIRTASAVAMPASTEVTFTAFGAILSEGDDMSVFEYATDGSYIQRTYVKPGGTMTTSSTTASLKIRAETNDIEGSYVKLTYYTEYEEGR